MANSSLNDIDNELQKVTELYEELLSKREALLVIEKNILHGHHHQINSTQKNLLSVQDRNQNILDDIDKLEKEVAFHNLIKHDGKLIALKERYLDYVQFEFGEPAEQDSVGDILPVGQNGE